MTTIKNGKIITPTGICEGKNLLIANDRIKGISECIEDIKTVIDAQGRYIMPGIIDVHSDKIEQFIQPRPTSQMNFSFALKICERDLLSAGITTMYHGIALFNDTYFGSNPLRTRDNVLKITELIANIQNEKWLIRHRVHLRIEIDNIDGYSIARELIEQNKVHLISFMDHTPGQGQYRDIDTYFQTVSGIGTFDTSHMTPQRLAEHHKNKPTLSFEQLKELASFAREKGIAVASHDDTLERLPANREIGVTMSEFPISLEAAKKAKEMGFQAIVGAPNILRGSSHCGNLSGAHAIIEDAADIICSDYYPAAMLQSVFHMHEQHNISLPQMVNRVTLNPARALGIHSDYGAIEQGKKADLLIVDVQENAPMITDVFVNGNHTLNMQYWS